MATVTIVFRKDKINKKGEAPIHFRITKNRKTSYISLGVMIPVDAWDEKKLRIKGKHPHSGRLNSLLSNKFNELQDTVLELETSSKLQTGKQIRSKVFGLKPLEFFPFADEAIEKYKVAGKIGTYDGFRSILKKLKKYVGQQNLMFQDITPDFLNKYELYSMTKYNNCKNTVHRDFKLIRNLFNQAIAQDKVDMNLSPFKKMKLKTEKTQVNYLTEAEVEAIEKLTFPEGGKIEMHRDMFIFAAYAGGLRISDILQLKWPDFDGTYIRTRITKTGGQLSIKLPNKALAIIEKYKQTSNSRRFIFPALSESLNLDNARALDEAISRATALTNKNLKAIAKKAEITKRVSFHVSRHSWATRALTKGMTIDKVSKLMGHANLRETMIYAKVVSEELDKAMDVFN